ncbi:hypothetical protein [Flavobacterium sp. UBA6135]|uniref:hypothetical protein n=1 Tax=Flavobacterium sp. UBA6135 TaxID=1946553 RepID=UPI0025C2789D|nr:hypothetical protein [Flavobacterium sp. UBA6135]
MKGNNEEARSINNYLNMMQSKALGIKLQLLRKNEELTIENFQNILFEDDENVRMLIPILEGHNNRMKELIGKIVCLRYFTSI